MARTIQQRGVLTTGSLLSVGRRFSSAGNVRARSVLAKRSALACAVLVVLSLSFAVAPPVEARAAAFCYSAAYVGQSAYAALLPGQSTTAIVAFANTGACGWLRDSNGQVDLAAV